MVIQYGAHYTAHAHNHPTETPHTITGTIGFVACYLFVRMIYGAVKIGMWKMFLCTQQHLKHTTSYNFLMVPPPHRLSTCRADATFAYKQTNKNRCNSVNTPKHINHSHSTRPDTYIQFKTQYDSHIAFPRVHVGTCSTTANSKTHRR